jgi:hypothetical protein
MAEASGDAGNAGHGETFPEPSAPENESLGAESLNSRESLVSNASYSSNDSQPPNRPQAGAGDDDGIRDILFHKARCNVWLNERNAFVRR